MNNYINHWANKILCEEYRENPDDYKAERLDIEADRYEEEMKAREEMHRQEMKEKKANAKEEMTADEILAHGRRREEQERAAEDARMVTVVIDDLDAGEVSGRITFASGRTENFTQEISDEEIEDMFEKLSGKVKGSNIELTLNDAAMAVVRARLGDESTEWLLGPSKTDIDEWAFNDDVDPMMLNRKYDQDWARVNGMYGDEDDSGTDADIYGSSDGMSDY